MATKVYRSPKEIEVPEIDFANFNRKEHFEKQEAYKKELKAFCKEHGSGKYAGETFRIPMADSYAEYMVISLKPCQVFHMPIGDAWDSQDVYLYTAKHIKQLVDSEKRMAELFGKNLN